MASQPTVVIVGAGIMGLAHAWLAAEAGWQVQLIERSRRACGGSIRNFGMIWPIGQRAGEPYRVALASRQRWLDLALATGIRAAPCGSIHLAYRDDEWQVLSEFAERAPGVGYEVELLSPGAVREATPAARKDGLRGGLRTKTELAVDPAAAVTGLTDLLAARYRVKFSWETTAVNAETGSVVAADGRRWICDRVMICSGADFETLFPRLLGSAGLTRCKLQMMATVPQPAGWQLGSHLASGLTLRHYPAFEICPSLPELRARIKAETPELDRYGIHVMAAQHAGGEVILGDSHEYDEAMTPFDSAEIDELILREIRRCLELPDWTIARRWHGVYAKHPTALQFAADPMPGVGIRVAPGGAGMTLAFGLAESDWQSQTQSA